MDYQTAGGGRRLGRRYGVAKVGGGPADTVLSNRYYLADADFLVGLEGDDSRLLEELDAALAAPVWQLSLGRKSYVPGVPVGLPGSPPLGPGLRHLPLREALQAYPWPGDQETGPQQLRLVIDGDGPGAEIRRDVPLSFAQRTFAVRTVLTEWLTRPAEGR